jgi:uncharacterized membrane protein
MKKILSLAIVFALFSCEQIEKIDRQMDADSADIANEIADMTGTLQALEKLAGESELLYKAVGSEPGWYAEFRTNTFKLLTNYGKDSIVLFQDFYAGQDFNFSYTNDENGHRIKLNVKVEDKECTDAAGNKNPNTVTVTFNDQVMSGCGTEVKN